MAKAPLIGNCDCPECGHTSAEIRETKNGKAYRYCEICNAQYFARDGVSDARLRAKARPVQAEGQPKKSEPASTTEPVKTEPKKGFSLEDLN